MTGRKRGVIPAALRRAQDRFEAWRRTRERGTRIPMKLWDLAVGLARQHGVSRTASVLKLDYHALKNRVQVKSSPATDASAAFVEIAPPVMPVSGECMIEFEDGAGACLRVRLRGCDVPDLVALGRSFWSDR
mgnify:CR=1 FL=1